MAVLKKYCALMLLTGVFLGLMSVSVVYAEEDGNLALNKPANGSSIEKNDFTYSEAFDGDLTSRWSSKASDPQWISVDLGAVYYIGSVKLIWEAAYGKSYQILVSMDNNTWEEVYSTISGAGGTESIVFKNGGVNARYVKMNGTERPKTYGYSLYEFEVYKAPLVNNLQFIAADNSAYTNHADVPVDTKKIEMKFNIDVVSDTVTSDKFQLYMVMDSKEYPMSYSGSYDADKKAFIMTVHTALRPFMSYRCRVLKGMMSNNGGMGGEHIIDFKTAKNKFWVNQASFYNSQGSLIETISAASETVTGKFYCSNSTGNKVKGTVIIALYRDAVLEDINSKQIEIVDGAADLPIKTIAR